MPENQPETPIYEPISEPVSPQEPALDAPISPSISEPSAVSPQAPESPKETESAIPVNNDNKQISPVEPETPVPEQTPLEPENTSNGAGGSEEVPPPMPTAHIPVIEPFAKLTLLAKAREAIQFRKRKKLEKIIEALNTKGKITNDEVEKLLHVSDATATRYLQQLEKEGKIKQSGRTGQSVSYSRI